MKNLFIVATTLALAAPLAIAQEKKVDPPAAKSAATKSHSTQSASDRQVAKQLQATGSGAATLGAASKPETRDWAKIDTNRDHLISPDEMQKYLEESWAAQKK
ncbi:MAG: hypothetical protein ACRCTM_18650 [Sphaerotilus sulfidivorans]|uniref:hypothetical protein n=1 Tax=Sphaerotilus sulfidivorans TaxID=639200 RepID=UPI003F2B5D3E